MLFNPFYLVGAQWLLIWFDFRVLTYSWNFHKTVWFNTVSADSIGEVFGGLAITFYELRLSLTAVLVLTALLIIAVVKLHP